MTHTTFTAALLVAAGLAGAGQPAPKRPRITGINHVALRVADAAGARRFYGELLGLAGRLDDRQRLVFTVGARQHVLVAPGLPAGEDERLSHLAFETTDLPALRAYFASNGVNVQQPNDRCTPDAILVLDPDGHPVEFVQAVWPPAASSGAAGAALSSRLLHAGLTVRDEAAAHRFYAERLGFSEFWRGGRNDQVTNWVNMRVPDGTDYLEYMLITEPPDRRQRGVLHHVALLVPDIQRAWETVVQRSTPESRSTLSPPNVGRNGRWQLNLYDPDGTRTELMEPFTVR
jgi:lactoylglutathione lyase